MSGAVLTIDIFPFGDIGDPKGVERSYMKENKTFTHSHVYLVCKKDIPTNVFCVFDIFI